MLNIDPTNQPEEDLYRVVYKYLESARHPLTSRQLTRRIRSEHKCPEYKIARELRNLFKCGKVVQRNGKWLVKTEEKTNDGQLYLKESKPVISRPNVSPETAELIWGFDPTEGDEQSKETEKTPRNWSYFRKLLAYYRECVRNEGGSKAMAYCNQLGKTFLFLHKTSNWMPKSGTPWRTFIPLGPHLSEFVNSLPREGDDTSLVLGYPVSAFYKEEKLGPPVSGLMPVFFYSVECSLKDQGLVLHISEPIPEVNLQWLEYAFSRKNESQNNFLSACGFIRSGMAEIKHHTFDKHEIFPSLGSLTSTLNTFLPRKIVEPLNPFLVPSEPIKEPFQNGIYNRAVVMLAKKTMYSARLLKELTAIASASDKELDRTALRHVFFDAALPDTEGQEINKDPADEEIVADVFTFNAAQRRAVASLLTNKLSVITGPPGTGKSQVVAGCTINALFNDKSVLFSSRNHKAIDAVVHRLTDSKGTPLIIRANSKEDPNLRFNFSKAIRSMLVSQSNPLAREKMDNARRYLKKRLAERGKAALEARHTAHCASLLGEIEEKVSYLKTEMDQELTAFLDRLPEVFPNDLVQQISKMILTASLISSTRDEACKVKGGRFAIIKFFYTYLKLRFALKAIPGIPSFAFLPIRKARILLNQAIPGLSRASEYSQMKQDAKSIENDIRHLPPLEKNVKNLAEITRHLEGHLEGMKTLYVQSRQGLPEGVDSATLAGLRSGLNSLFTGLLDGKVDRTVRQTLVKEAPGILKAFPAWAVTSLSIGSRIPLLPGLFDLALIDEASQSDIPSAIPILFRAKRAGVIGDPLQLTHVSKLSLSKDTMLWKKIEDSEIKDFRFSYSQYSLYDLCASIRAVDPVLLNITYRGSESIAQYSNHLFYGGNLQVGTDPEGLNPPSGMKPGIHWTEISGDIASAGGSGCYCTQEIGEVVKVVGNMLEQNNFKGSIGVVTPFRQQANRIQDALFDGGVNYAVLNSAQLMVQTAHGFQGDERDVIIFSLCAGPDMPQGSRAFLRETGYLFNVAVSRARAVLHVIGNKKWASSCGISHIQKLADDPVKIMPQPQATPWAPHESPWEKVLFEALMDAGLDPKPQFPVRNRRLDMALIRSGDPELKLDIEVDGDCHRNPDGSRKFDDTWRDIQLQGLGWKVIRFWTYQLRENLHSCVDDVVKIWEGK